MQVTLDAGHSGPVTHPREPGPEFPLMSAAWARAVRADTGRPGIQWAGVRARDMGPQSAGQSSVWCEHTRGKDISGQEHCNMVSSVTPHIT